MAGSVVTAASAFAGPLLVTTIVNDSGDPGLISVVLGVLVIVNVKVLITTQLGVTLLFTLVTVTLADVFVNACGEVPQLGLAWPGWLVTSTVTVQLDAPAFTCRFATTIDVVPATAVVMPATAAFGQVPPMFGLAATWRPLGRLSVKPTLLSAELPAGLVTVNVGVVLSP